MLNLTSSDTFTAYVVSCLENNNFMVGIRLPIIASHQMNRVSQHLIDIIDLVR